MDGLGRTKTCGKGTQENHLRKGANGKRGGIKIRGKVPHLPTTTGQPWLAPAGDQQSEAPLPTYLASILHVVLLSGLGADPGAGAGGALLGATQDDGILVQVPTPLHCDANRPCFLTDIVARSTQKGGV